MKRFDLGLLEWRKLNKHELVQVEFLFPQHSSAAANAGIANKIAEVITFFFILKSLG